MTNVIPIRRRKSKSLEAESYSGATTEGRFTGRMGPEQISLARGVFFEIITDDGSKESWPCVIASKLVRPALDTFKAGDPVSVCGHLKPRPYAVGGVTRIAHGVYAIEALPADFPQGLRLL
jgi:hypothetical protein